jgi:SNF2 family DNA or RNA helicase
VFQSHSEFKDWFSNPLNGMIESNGKNIDENLITRLHSILRPFILRRLKKDVEKQLPQKIEHIVKCNLSKRQRQIYEEYMSKAETKENLESGNLFRVLNIIMQLRKVCNHPDLFETRPIVSPFTSTNIVYNPPSIITKNILKDDQLYLHDEEMEKKESKDNELLGDELLESYYNRINEEKKSNEKIKLVNSEKTSFLDIEKKDILDMEINKNQMKEIKEETNLIKTNEERSIEMKEDLQNFTCYIPKTQSKIEMKTYTPDPSKVLEIEKEETQFNETFSNLTEIYRDNFSRQQVSFPNRKLLQYDCGKLQKLSILLTKLKKEGHRCLIFTQMSKMLNILEIFLSMHSFTYFRLDGSTKIDQRQYLMDRFNQDDGVFVFILSTRSGGVGMNLTGADTVIFYDSDWNPAMDLQAQDRCHRIGQTKDVNIYRLISDGTIEERILQKAIEKTTLNNIGK